MLNMYHPFSPNHQASQKEGKGTMFYYMSQHWCDAEQTNPTCYFSVHMWKIGWIVSHATEKYSSDHDQETLECGSKCIAQTNSNTYKTTQNIYLLLAETTSNMVHRVITWWGFQFRFPPKSIWCCSRCSWITFHHFNLRNNEGRMSSVSCSKRNITIQRVSQTKIRILLNPVYKNLKIGSSIWFSFETFSTYLH